MDGILPKDTAWRMFTKVIDPETAQASALVRGDTALAPSSEPTVKFKIRRYLDLRHLRHAIAI
jgi:hypothetical protein